MILENQLESIRSLVSFVKSLAKDRSPSSPDEKILFDGGDLTIRFTENGAFIDAEEKLGACLVITVERTISLTEPWDNFSAACKFQEKCLDSKKREQLNCLHPQHPHTYCLRSICPRLKKN